MQALDKKLVRDFARLWLQGLAIAVVLACGVAILLTAFGMNAALTDTRAAYYERNRFAEIFVDTRRAPLTLLPEILDIPGVYTAEPRVQGGAILDLPGRDEVAMGQILSWPADDAPLLNVPVLRSGTYPAGADEVMVTTAFAEANGFVAGDVFHANLNGQRRALTITGTALSPEFIYTIGPGALMPDNEGYGILWMTEAAVAAAYDMAGAFNHLALRISAEANPQDVMDRLDTTLDAYGGLGAYDRSSQVSDAFVSAEIDQLKGMAMVVPPIFFAISAFLVGMVISRIVALDRAEIGLLKALGYSDLEVCLHYLLLAAMIALLGTGIGWGLGTILARAMAMQYATFFDFPYLIFRVPVWVYAMSGLAALLTTMLGATRAALMAARLAPAVAMQPPAPPMFRRGFLDRMMSAMALKQTTIMVLRSIVRWPIRSLLTAAGLGAATSAVIAAGFMFGALTRIIDLAFNQSYRQDAMILFSHDLPETSLSEIARLPGVLQVEPQQFHSATLRNGPREKRVALEARPEDATLSRVIGAEGEPIVAPPGGLLLSERLAEQLELSVGDNVEVEFMTGRRETHEMVVTGLVEQFLGLGAYADMDFLDTVFRRSGHMSVANVLVDENRLPDLHAALQETPALSGLILMNENRRSFEETISQNVSVVNTIYAAIAVLITVGVAYNGARIQLSERARELASLRILGFSRAEVSSVLVGETMLLALLAQPLGWLFGAWIARALSNSFTSDLYAIPLVLSPDIFARASLIVLIASFASVMLVRRRIDRMDLVAVMKTRE
ncbi:FtsX-like permease family protein [Roseibacterium sp. SDUM158016]|uniref:ABC transporter permease n=1 Tax=Roseicyclus sediminis TaxID=2980997 RepID=UPI0021D14B50|nr:FtsX-like permease family protein [Roseibacterium sp. SDUM158016]MCU4651720.1 FtsX-like permease family protein [Roseibacterium sp. SDUM158016]